MTEEYQEKITELLSDKATYKTLKKGPTRDYKAEFIRMLSALEKEVQITKDQHLYLFPKLEKHHGYMAPQRSTKRVFHPCQLYTNNSIHSAQRHGEHTTTTVGKTEHHTENSQELVIERERRRMCHTILYHCSRKHLLRKHAK